MKRPPLPPEFDPVLYRRENPDLDLADDAAAAEHYQAIGRTEGRIAAHFARREGMIAAIGDGSTLEIGPFCDPLLRGPNVEYLDRLTSAQLRQRALSIGMDPAGCPETIHHVGGLAQVNGRYANIVASHSIEHHPDLVRHLEQVSRLLEAGGRYWLIVPDKRYCFDHFLPESSIADVVGAFQEARDAHSLKSVIEHVALVTHNDSERHWRGDHGELPPPGLERRVTDAVEAYALGQGSYIDVHAWQFTPESFRALMGTLKTLGLTSLEVERVYDTPRGRMEFCAVLRQPDGPRLTTPRGIEGRDIIMMQTADPYRYAPMLAATSLSVTEYCRRWGARYESFVGIKRGHWHWQATFNRIIMLQELLDRGFRGWAIYLDADAYIQDLGFDLPAYLSDKAEYGAIFATSGVTGEHWDVNAGIAFLNLGNAQGRRLVRLWSEAFAGVSDERLRAGELWFEGDNDQDLLQRILREDRQADAATLVVSMDFINSPHARFIRQHLRAQAANLIERIATISVEVHAVLARWDVPHPIVGALEQQARARLRNPVTIEPLLTEAEVPAPSPHRAAVAIARFAACEPAAASSPALRTFAALLQARDQTAVAEEITRLGRSSVGQGLLGGRRQHERAASDEAFARQRALQTYDALVSLAEITGALPFEQPQAGSWGDHAAMMPAPLVEALGQALGADLAPPESIGGHLGLAIGFDYVLHLRMIEAIHAAWRVRQLCDQTGGTRIAQFGGGAGLTAWYARALGVADYRIVDEPVLLAIQAYVLADRPGVSLVENAAGAGRLDVALSEDSFGDRGAAYAEAAFRAAREGGARAFLSLNADLGEDALSVGAIAAACAWKRVSRHPHALRPGFADEVFVPC